MELYKLSPKLQKFNEFPAIMVGGGALRAFIRFSREIKDGDFVLKKQKNSSLEKIKEEIIPKANIEYMQRESDYGFMRCVDSEDKKRGGKNLYLDFMEGKIKGERENQEILIDEKFVENSQKIKITFKNREFEFYVPEYKDYLILKIVSARKSDALDIAALIQEKGIPPGIKKRTKQILPYPQIFDEGLEKIKGDISHPEFIKLWSETFKSTELTEEIKQKILSEIIKLKEY